MSDFFDSVNNFLKSKSTTNKTVDKKLTTMEKKLDSTANTKIQSPKDTTYTSNNVQEYLKTLNGTNKDKTDGAIIDKIGDVSRTMSDGVKVAKAFIGAKNKVDKENGTRSPLATGVDNLTTFTSELGENTKDLAKKIDSTLLKEKFDARFGDTSSVTDKIKNDNQYVLNLIDESGNLKNYDKDLELLNDQKKSETDITKISLINQQIKDINNYKKDQEKLVYSQIYKNMVDEGASQEDIDKFINYALNGDMNLAERAGANFVSTLGNYVGGTLKTIETLNSEINLLAGGDVNNNKTFGDYIIDNAQELQVLAHQGAGGVEKAVYEIYNAGAGSLYSLGLSYVTGGLLNVFGQEAASKLVVGNSLYFNDMSVFGNQVHENIKNGYDYQTSLDNALGITVASHITESIGGERLVKLLSTDAGVHLVNGAFNYVLESAKYSFFPEAIEEGAEKALDLIIEKQTTNTGMTMQEYLNKVFSKDTFYEMFIGGLSGLVSNVPAIGIGALNFNADVNTIASQTVDIKSEKDYNQTQELMADIKKTIEEYNAKGIEDKDLLLSKIYNVLDIKSKNYKATHPYSSAIQMAQDTDVMASGQFSDTTTIANAATPIVQNRLDNISILADELKQRTAKTIEMEQEEVNKLGAKLGEVDYNKLNEQQAKELKIVEDVIAKTGRKVEYASIIDKETGEIIDGFYDQNKKLTVINPNAKTGIVTTLIHEFTHGNESSLYYGKLKDLAIEVTGKDNFKSLVDRIQRGYGDAVNLDTTGAEKEAVAKTVQDLLGNQDFVDRLVQYDTSLAYRLYDEIKYMNKETGFVDDIEQTFKRAFSDSGKLLNVSKQDGSVAFNIASLQDQYGNEVDKDVAAKDIASQLDIGEEQARKYIDDMFSVANIIAQQDQLLDYDPNYKYSSLKSNSDYKYTIDFSTLCKKRILLQGTIDAIQNQLANESLKSEDYIRIRQIMQEKGYVVSCGFCYVDSARRQLGSIAQAFIDGINEVANDKQITTTTNDKQLNALESLRNTSPDALKGIEIKDLITINGVEKLQGTNPDIYNAFVSFNNARGQARDMLVQTRTNYRGEILDITDKNIEYLITHGGLRLQSYSDFETPHLLDAMQVITDMSRRGLTSQAYTKVPDFADAFGNTNVKINLSLVTKGLDEKGNLIFDDVEGMPHEKAFELRDKYSKNVGTVLVGKDKATILAAMADDRIDYIIPFHQSGWTNAEMENLGIKGYDDFTDWQHEKLLTEREIVVDVGKKSEHTKITKKIKDVGEFQPVEYWDFSVDGKTNAERYLEMCAKDHRKPKFENFLVDNGNGTWSLQPDGSTDGYWKTLIDFKMYDNDGVGSPQEKVVPIFNQDVNNRILSEYKGEHRTYSPAQDVVEQFIKERREGTSGGQFTYAEKDFLRDSENQLLQFSKKLSNKTDSDGNQLTNGQVDYFKNSKVRDANGNLEVMYHGTQKGGFTQFDSSNSFNNTGFFFTNNINNASSYSESKDLYNPYSLRANEQESFRKDINKLNTLDDINKWLENNEHSYIDRNGNESWETYRIKREYVKYNDTYQYYILGNEEGASPIGIDNGNEKEIVENAKKFIINKYTGIKTNYPIYLDIKNPLVINANGNTYNGLPSYIIEKGYDNLETLKGWNKLLKDTGFSERYKFIKENGDDILVDTYHDNSPRMENLDINEFINYCIENHLGDDDIPKENIDKFYNIVHDLRDREDYNETGTTNTYLLYAYENGYDGVIFNDIIDYGGEDETGNYDPSKVVVAFNPEQIKSIYNETPTSSSDIKFSKGIDYNENTQDIPQVLTSLQQKVQKSIDNKSQGFLIVELANYIDAYRSNAIDKKQIIDFLNNKYDEYGTENAKVGKAIKETISLLSEDNVVKTIRPKLTNDEKAQLDQLSVNDALGNAKQVQDALYTIKKPSGEEIAINNDKELSNYLKSDEKAFDDFVQEKGIASLPTDTLDKMESDGLEYITLDKVKEQVTKVEEDKENKRKQSTIKESIDKAKQKFVDRGSAIYDLGRKTKSDIYAWYNNYRNASSMADYQIYKKDGWADIINEIPKDQQNDFSYMMYHWLNTDTYKYKKPVFGDITDKQSQQIVDQYLEEHPTWKDTAQKVWDYEKNLREELVKHGRISRQTANTWEEMYPHYVHIVRDSVDINEVPNAIQTEQEKVKSSNKGTVQERTGGNSPLRSLNDAITQQTKQVYSAVTMNDFVNEYVKVAKPSVKVWEDYQDRSIDAIDKSIGNEIQAPDENTPATFIFYDNGDTRTIEVPADVYNAFVVDKVMDNKLTDVTTKVNEIRRNLITSQNITFAARNIIKDTQDVLMKSEHPVLTYSMIPQAIVDMANNSETYQLYRSLGGGRNNATQVTEGSNFYKKTVGNIERANNFIETLPRYAEFKASLSLGRTQTQAMYDADKVTTNFKMGGDYTKFADRNGFTFLNASVQGFNELYRDYQSAYDRKGIKGILGKMAIATLVYNLPLMVVNHLRWKDDEDYENLSDYVKDGYYILWKNEDGTFARIPKGRIAAAYQSVLQGIYNAGEELTSDNVDKYSNAWNEFIGGFVKSWDNVGINNPFQNNILAPIKQVLENKTWYGDEILSENDLRKDNKDQYDTSTDELSKWIGENTNTSPKIINYLLNQYSGGVGDIVLPMLTPKAENELDDGTIGGKIASAIASPIVNDFRVDPVFKNQNVTDLFELDTALAKKSNKENATSEEQLASKYITSIKYKMFDLYGDRNNIYNDETLTDAEKYRQARAIQQEIDLLAKYGLETYDQIDIVNNYAQVGDVSYINKDGSWSKITSKELEEINSLGMTTTQKADYFEIKDVINNNNKETGVNAIINSSLSDEQKNYLYDKYYSTKVSDNIDELDISDAQKVDLKYAVSTAEGQKDSSGKTIANSKASQIAGIYEQAGVLDNIIAYMEANNLNPSDFGLSKTVYNNYNGTTASNKQKKAAQAYMKAIKSANSDLMSYLNNMTSIEDAIKNVEKIKAKYKK